MIDPAAPRPDEARPREDRTRASGSVSGPSFAHASEAEMSRILDFYGVAWRYEPTTFPILWNLEGDVVESFSPDFYLPELDLYLEMTTLKQSLVRKKNRKLRRLRELYPDVRIKLFYARDFRAMMLKYGRLGLAESLTGTSGQLVAGVLAGDGVTAGDPATSGADADPRDIATPRDRALELAGAGHGDAPSARSPEAVASSAPASGPVARRHRAGRATRSGADVEIA